MSAKTLYLTIPEFQKIKEKYVHRRLKAYIDEMTRPMTPLQLLQYASEGAARNGPDSEVVQILREIALERAQ